MKSKQFFDNNKNYLSEYYYCNKSLHLAKKKKNLSSDFIGLAFFIEQQFIELADDHRWLDKCSDLEERLEPERQLAAAWILAHRQGRVLELDVGELWLPGVERAELQHVELLNNTVRGQRVDSDNVVTWKGLSQRLQVATWQTPHNLQKTFRQVFNSSFKDLMNSERVKLGSLKIAFPLARELRP